MDFMTWCKSFHKNRMPLHPEKFQLIVIGDKDLSHEKILNHKKITSSIKKNY